MMVSRSTCPGYRDIPFRSGRSGFLGWLVCFAALVLTGLPAVVQADTFRFVDVTGRAALHHTADAAVNIDKARRLALEEALYLAALEGGADINGFQASISDLIVSDELVVRPAGSILNFSITDEAEQGDHYIVSIRAAVGRLPESTCQNRMFSKLTVFAPKIETDRAIHPGLTSQVPVLLNSMIEHLQNKQTLGLTLALNTPYTPSTGFAIPAAFDYRAITSGRKSIDNGDFAVVPEIVLKHRKSGTMFVKDEEMTLQISLNVFESGAEVPGFILEEEVVLPLGSETPLRSFDILTRPRLDTLVAGLLAPAGPLAERLAQAINCRKLVSTLQLEDGNLVIPIGSNQGVRADAMGVLNDPTKPVQFLTIARLEPGRTLLAPLNPSVSAASLAGRTIEFMEFKP